MQGRQIHFFATATTRSSRGELQRTTRFVLFLIALQQVHVSSNVVRPKRGSA